MIRTFQIRIDWLCKTELVPCHSFEMRGTAYQINFRLCVWLVATHSKWYRLTAWLRGYEAPFEGNEVIYESQIMRESERNHTYPYPQASQDGSCIHWLPNLGKPQWQVQLLCPSQPHQCHQRRCRRQRWFQENPGNPWERPTCPAIWRLDKESGNKDILCRVKFFWGVFVGFGGFCWKCTQNFLKSVRFGVFPTLRHQRTLFCFAWSPRRKNDEGVLNEAENFCKQKAAPLKHCILVRKHQTIRSESNTRNAMVRNLKSKGKEIERWHVL